MTSEVVAVECTPPLTDSTSTTQLLSSSIQSDRVEFAISQHLLPETHPLNIARIFSSSSFWLCKAVLFLHQLAIRSSQPGLLVSGRLTTFGGGVITFW